MPRPSEALVAARAAAEPAPAWPRELLADLRSDQAGETGAICIYRGVLAFARDPALRRFAEHHLATERTHLALIERHLPPGRGSRLLPAWRLAGWLTGALPALFGPRAVYATIAAVETFVDHHYAAQTARIDALLAAAARGEPAAVPPAALLALRAEIESCRHDECRHRDEALAAGASRSLPVRAWATLVGRGSSAAVLLARRF